MKYTTLELAQEALENAIANSNIGNVLKLGKSQIHDGQYKIAKIHAHKNEFFIRDFEIYNCPKRMWFNIHFDTNKTPNEVVTKLKSLDGVIDVNRKALIAWSQDCDMVSILNEVTEILSGFGAEFEKEDEEDYNRSLIEDQGYEALSTLDKIKYDKFWSISKSISDVIGFANLFDVDHANTIKSHRTNAISPSNLQLMYYRANRKKNAKSQERYTWEQQVLVVKGAIIGAGIFMNAEQEELVDYYLSELKLVY